METPKQPGFYGSIRQQFGAACQQMEKSHFPLYPKHWGSVTLPMRCRVMLPPVMPPQPWPCPEA